jgi:hypothetical protein
MRERATSTEEAEKSIDGRMMFMAQILYSVLQKTNCLRLIATCYTSLLMVVCCFNKQIGCYPAGFSAALEG